MITFLGFIINIIAAYFILTNKLIVGGILVWLGLIFDFVDGEIARLKNLQSNFGEWFDGVLDRVGDIFIMGAIAINVFFHNQNFYVLALCLLAFISTTLWRYFALVIKTTFKVPEKKNKDMPLIGYDVAMHALIVALAAIFNQLFYLVLFFAIILNLTWVKNIVVAIIKYHK